MALSVLTHPKEVMRALSREFEIVDEEDVLQFLEHYPAIPPLLFETRDAIRRFFGNDRVKLEVFRDPEWPEDAELLVNVLLHAGPKEALELLNRFDYGWWLDKKRSHSHPPVLVSVALQ